MTERDFHTRLSAALKSLAAAAIPEADGGASLSPHLDSLDCKGEFADVAASGDDADSTRRPLILGRRRYLKGKRSGVVIGLVVALTGTGVAAASGVFRPTRPPKVNFGAAHNLTKAADGYMAPGEVTRFIGPGPGGVTFVVVSASSHPDSGCIKLDITGDKPGSKEDQTIPGGCSAAFNVRTSQPRTSTPSSNPADYYPAVEPWTSPTGTSYTVEFGDASPSATSVRVLHSTGKSARGRQLVSTPTSDGWFALAFVVPRSGCDTIEGFNASGTGVIDLGKDGQCGGI